ncbi:MAG: hypothetical protein KY410_04820 [Proteobacteria bacterium]|nr:hypothetical protein [Pseudomonadota bacterium]
MNENKEEAGFDRAERSNAAEAEQSSGTARRYWKTLTWALGEISIVAVGILIAFSLNAWWDDRSMAQQEQMHLHALAGDFEQNVAELRELVEMEKRIASYSLKLLNLSETNDVEPPESLAGMTGEVFNSARFEPVMGAYEGLVNSGGLTLIQDEQLRASLAYFAAQVRNRYAEDWSNEHYFSFSREFGGRVLLILGKPQEDREDVLRSLLADPRFQEHLALRYYSERDMAARYDRLLQQAETVLAGVRAQMRE